MKAFSIFFKKHIVFGLLATLGISMMASCSKNDPDGPNTNTPSAGLMAFNLAPDRPSVSFALGANQFGTAALGYTGYTGNYLPINIGDRQVRAYDASNGQTLATNNYSFVDSALYSVFVVGHNGVYRNIITLDDNGTITATAGKAWVRYINAITDTAARPFINVADTTQQAVFGAVSNFFMVNAGPVDVSIGDSGNFETSRTITMEANKVYTVLFVGVPGSTDPQLTPQVKFIVNGTAD